MKHGFNLTYIELYMDEDDEKEMEMRVSMSVVLLSLVTLAVPAFGQEPTFVTTADEMVDQMLDSDTSTSQFGKTRSFVTVEEPQQPTRGVTVRRKDKQGVESTVVVQVPVGLDPAARLKVEFDVDSATLRPSAYEVLGELAKALQNEKVVDHNVCIKGHTDADGSDEHNLRLSFSRADSVKRYLLSAYSLPAERLEVFGYGESMPLVSNVSLSDKQMNRRVEVSLNCAEISH